MRIMHIAKNVLAAMVFASSVIILVMAGTYEGFAVSLTPSVLTVANLILLGVVVLLTWIEYRHGSINTEGEYL